MSIFFRSGRKERDTLLLVKRLQNLEPIEYIGLCKILKVEMVDEHSAPLDFSVTIEQVIEKFSQLGKRQRKEILDVLSALGEAE